MLMVTDDKPIQMVYLDGWDQLDLPPELSKGKTDAFPNPSEEDLTKGQGLINFLQFDFPPVNPPPHSYVLCFHDATLP